MPDDVLIDFSHVNKVFYTGHFLQRDEESDYARKLYRRKRIDAVRDVSFQVKRGEIFGLLGPNGAGKTTTVKMISGLVRPSSGEVMVDGLKVETQRLKVLRKIGVVLEGTRTIIWPLTPLENLAYFGNLKDVKGKVLRQRSRELIEFIGLRHRMNTQVRRLSRGEKQKLAICVALIADPEVLLLDEPTTGLDVQSARNIKDKVTEMAREQGRGVLVTTHDMNVAQQLCDRIGIIDDGKLVALRPTEELLDLFADHTYEFRLDARPDLDRLRRIEGIEKLESCEANDGPQLVVTFEADEHRRSAAMYSVMERLKSERRCLKSVSHRKQTLENVFLELTRKDNTKPVEEAKN